MNSKYITSLMEKDERLDNRKLNEYRKIEITTGISKNAEGSAKCKIGNTEVNVGVKLGLGEPYPDSPDQGTIMVTAELSPIASSQFELGPPGIKAIELARIVDRSIRESKTLDFKKLCIKEGEKIWMAFIDIYPLNDDGNLVDASVLATIAALQSEKYPKLDVKGDKYEVDYHEHQNKKLDLNKPPITMTFSMINNKIIVDPTTEEEAVVQARLSIAVKDGIIHALQKGEAKALKIEQIDKMLDLAIKKEAELRKLLPK